MQLLHLIALHGALGYSLAWAFDLGTFFKFGIPLILLAGNMLVQPLMANRSHRIDWNPDQPPLGDDVRQFLVELFQMHGKAPPADLAALLGRDQQLPIALGLVKQDAPQLQLARAPTGGAGLVVSEGFSRVLTPAQQKAALAHEVYYLLKPESSGLTKGLMTLPTLLFTAYRFIDPDPGGNFFQRYIGQILYGAYRLSLAGAAWSVRSRVYLADRFAFEMTGDAEALATAILRLTYGLAEAGQADEMGSPLDIADPSQAAALHDAAPDASVAGLARALRWERVNLAARLFELFSHHPLPSRRLDELAGMAASQGREWPYHPDPDRGGYRVAGLVAEVLGRAAPWLGAYAGYRYCLAYDWPSNAVFFGLLGFTAGYAAAAAIWYRPLSRYRPTTARALLDDVDVSDSYPLSARLEGRIVGRDKAGYAFGADLRFRDESGAVTLRYKQPVPLLDSAFAYFEADALHGKEVRVDGWFRRAPEPVLEVRRIRVLETGRTYGCYRWLWHWAALGALGWLTRWVWRNV